MRLQSTYGDERTLTAACTILEIGVWVFNASYNHFEYAASFSATPSTFLFLVYRPYHYDILSIPEPIQLLFHKKFVAKQRTVLLSEICEPATEPSVRTAAKRRMSPAPDTQPAQKKPKNSKKQQPEPALRQTALRFQSAKKNKSPLPDKFLCNSLCIKGATPPVFNE